MIEAVLPKTGQRTVVHKGGYFPQCTASGMMLYRMGSATMERGLSWVDPAGKTEPIAISPGAYIRLALSPDNKRTPSARWVECRRCSTWNGMS